MTGARACVALFALLSGSCAALAETPRLVTEETWVKTGEPGVEVYVRNKHPDGLIAHSPERTLIYVHGATYPSETTFDLPIEGSSMMDLIAEQGFDVFLVDIYGYGRSSRPPEMDQPPEANKPLSGSEEANSDLAAAFDYVLKSRGIAKADLMGWSWGTSIAGSTRASTTTRSTGWFSTRPRGWLSQPRSPRRIRFPPIAW